MVRRFKQRPKKGVPLLALVCLLAGGCLLFFSEDDVERSSQKQASWQEQVLKQEVDSCPPGANASRLFAAMRFMEESEAQQARLLVDERLYYQRLLQVREALSCIDFGTVGLADDSGQSEGAILLLEQHLSKEEKRLSTLITARLRAYRVRFHRAELRKEQAAVLREVQGMLEFLHYFEGPLKKKLKGLERRYSLAVTRQ